MYCKALGGRFRMEKDGDVNYPCSSSFTAEKNGDTRRRGKKFGSGVQTPANAEPNPLNLNPRFRFRFRELLEPS
jgi:hypothetical protein